MTTKRIRDKESTELIAAGFVLDASFEVQPPSKISGAALAEQKYEPVEVHESLADKVRLEVLYDASLVRLTPGFGVSIGVDGASHETAVVLDVSSKRAVARIGDRQALVVCKQGNVLMVQSWISRPAETQSTKVLPSETHVTAFSTEMLEHVGDWVKALGDPWLLKTVLEGLERNDTWEVSVALACAHRYEHTCFTLEEIGTRLEQILARPDACMTDPAVEAMRAIKKADAGALREVALARAGQMEQELARLLGPEASGEAEASLEFERLCVARLELEGIRVLWAAVAALGEKGKSDIHGTYRESCKRLTAVLEGIDKLGDRVVAARATGLRREDPRFEREQADRNEPAWWFFKI